MDARAATEYLLDLELFGMRFGLDRMRRLTTALGMPQRRFASIHVVGTNGKSSTTRMIAAILHEHGYATGSYTSPHLWGFPERIEVGGQAISAAELAAAASRVRQAAEVVDRAGDADDRVTQFEALTATAFVEFARREVGVAVIEAGLGGRHDATNVIPSQVQVLTGVALDHTRWLGPTPAAIAEEKLAVVRDQGVLVTGRLDTEIDAIADAVARTHGARRVAVEGESAVALAVKGAVQRRNFAVATAAAAVFAGPLDPERVARAGAGLSLPGRLEVTARDPLVVHDGAHNPDAARALAESVTEVTDGRPLALVASILDDKDATGILEPLLKVSQSAVFTETGNPRALPAATLESLAAGVSRVPSELVRDPSAAVARGRELAGSGGAVLVTGSLHLIAELRREPSDRRASML